MSDDRREGQPGDPAQADSARTGGSDAVVPSPEHAAAALSELAALVESRIPPGYRSEAFRALARWRLGPASSMPIRDTAPGERRGAVPLAAAPVELTRPGRLDLSPFASILGGSGRMLQKALVALEVSRSQLGIDWLTPAEIERFLIERGRVRTAYRTNLSNALSGARHLVDRRRRGRGYEYRITAPGRELLEREVRLGSDV